MSSPIWASWPDIYYCLTVTVLFYVGRPLWREDRSVLYMQLALASAVFLRSESLGTRGHILLSQIWDFPFSRFLRLAGSRWRYSTPPPPSLSPTNLRHGPRTENTWEPRILTIPLLLQRQFFYLRFEVSTAVTMMIIIFWEMIIINSSVVAWVTSRMCLTKHCLAMYCSSWLSRKRVLTSRCLAMEYSVTIY
jgi:hypothetical protein